MNCPRTDYIVIDSIARNILAQCVVIAVVEVTVFCCFPDPITVIIVR